MGDISEESVISMFGLNYVFTITVCICTPTPREIHMTLYYFHTNHCKIVLRKLHYINYITSSDEQIFIKNEQNWISNHNLKVMHGTTMQITILSLKS